MRVLTVGSDGQLGRACKAAFSDAEKYELFEYPVEKLDITDENAVSKAFKDVCPDVVINCAAYTNVDKCENESEYEIAYRVNVLGALYLARECEKCGAALVHISSDYVFGNDYTSPIDEDAKTNPLNKYGQTKLKSEEEVQKNCKKHFVLRTAWLYGDGNNFVKTMLRLSDTKTELSVVADQTGSPTSAAELALCIKNLINTECYGIYHATAEGECTWWEFASAIFEMCNKNVKVNKTTTEEYNAPAKRAHYSVLNNKKLKELSLNTFRHWKEPLFEYLKELGY